MKDVRIDDEGPTHLDGADPATFVANRCQYSADQDVTSSGICSKAGR